jgi:hypothetical protein
MTTVTPAYGRDYKSKAAAFKDWEDGKDFILNDFSSRWNGKPCNCKDIRGPVMIRYDRMRKVAQYTP